MSRKVKEQQYLIDGTDGFLYIVHKKSIIVDDKYEELKIGMNVTFQWPEEAIRPKYYQGVILQYSTNESELKSSMDTIIRNREKKRKRSSLNMVHKLDANKRFKVGQGKADLEEKNTKAGNSYSSIQERKKSANILAAKEIMKDLESSKNLSSRPEAEIAQKSFPIAPPCHLKELNMKIDSILVHTNWVVEFLHEIKEVLTSHLVQDAEPSNPQPLLSSQRREDVDFPESSPISNRRSPYSPYPTSKPKKNEKFIPGRSRSCSPIDETMNFPPSGQDLDFPEFDDYESNTILHHAISDENLNPGYGPSSKSIPYNGSSNESSSDELPNDLSRGVIFTNRNLEQNNKEPSTSKSTTNVTVLHNRDCDDGSDDDDIFAEKTKEDFRSTDSSNAWTLKHTSNEKDKTLELIKGSKIFVTKRVITNIVLGSKNQTGLARMLLEAVFTAEALMTCSLAGGSSNGKGKKDHDKRPGLYKEGITTILNFVRKHAVSKNWVPVDDATVKMSLRSKLVELRKQHELNAHLK